MKIISLLCASVSILTETLGDMAVSAMAPITSARRMSFFVLALLVQWWPMAAWGTWALFVDDPNDIPAILYFFGIIFNNLGGVFNLIIYLVLNKKDNRSSQTESSLERIVKSASDSTYYSSSACTRVQQQQNRSP